MTAAEWVGVAATLTALVALAWAAGRVDTRRRKDGRR